MKRFITKFILVFAVLTLTPSLGWAEGVEIDGINYELIPKAKVAHVMGGNYAGDIIIPPSIIYNDTTYQVTSIKNMAFYHDLLEKIKNNNCRDDESRIIIEEGFIKTNNNRSMENDIDNFFMINDCFIWYDKTKLQGEINLLKEMSCKIKVVGYKMNCMENRNNQNHILKAIAIYIE